MNQIIIYGILISGKILKADKEAESGTSERLTEREYLAIGICSGFLLMLYIFAMVVFLLIRRRHRRDKRLREQFLNLPLPQGLGYKSSRILGLEDSFNPYFGRDGGQVTAGYPKVTRLSTRSDGRCSLHSRTGQEQIEQIYDITKVIEVIMFLDKHKLLSLKGHFRSTIGEIDFWLFCIFNV
jgi:hypothetical protein